MSSCAVCMWLIGAHREITSVSCCRSTSLRLSLNLSPIWRHIPSHMSGRLRQSSGCRTRCLSSGAASLALIMALPRVGFISALVQVTWQSQASAKMSINFRRVSRRLIEFFCLSSRLKPSSLRFVAKWWQSLIANQLQSNEFAINLLSCCDSIRFAMLRFIRGTLSFCTFASSSCCSHADKGA